MKFAGKSGNACATYGTHKTDSGGEDGLHGMWGGRTWTGCLHRA